MSTRVLSGVLLFPIKGSLYTTQFSVHRLPFLSHTNGDLRLVTGLRPA